MSFFTQFFACFFCFVSFSYAQKAPSWVRNTPIDSAYYIGIGSSQKSNTNYESLATKNALASIAEQIQINIKSESQLFVSEDQMGVDEDYFKNISTQTEMELQDFDKYKQWEDKKNYFVYYRLSKKKFRDNLLVAYNKAIFNSTQKTKEAETLFSANKIPEAIKAYLDASKFLEPMLRNTFIKEKHAEVFNLWQKTKSDLNSIALGFRLQTDAESLKIKKSNLKDKEFSVFTRFVKNNNSFLIGQVPVDFELIKNANAFYKRTIYSDEKGIAKNKIDKIHQESIQYMIGCKINFFDYFKSFGDYKILEEIDFLNTQSKLDIPFEVVPISVFILSDEQSFSRPRKFSTIKDQLVSELRNRNILFAKSPTNADYILKIKSDTQRGTEFEGFFTSLISVNYSLEESKSKKTIDSGTIYDIKGVGLNYSSAANKAYANFIEDIQLNFLDNILKLIN